MEIPRHWRGQAFRYRLEVKNDKFVKTNPYSGLAHVKSEDGGEVAHRNRENIENGKHKEIGRRKKPNSLAEALVEAEKNGVEPIDVTDKIVYKDGMIAEYDGREYEIQLDECVAEGRSLLVHDRVFSHGD